MLGPEGVRVIVGKDDQVADEREPSSETPYMRRARAVAVRQGRVPTGLRRYARWVAFIIGVLLPLLWGGYSLVAYVLNSPRFELVSPADVTVVGNHYVSRGEILSAMGIPNHPSSDEGSNILRTSLATREEQAESIPWVLSATVVRSYPRHLTVYVTERTPVAFVDAGGEIKMMDSHGVLLDTPDQSHFDFPIVKGLNFQEDPSDRESRISLYQQFMRETSKKISRSGWIVSEVNLIDADDLQALLVQGRETLLLHFGHADFLARFQNFLTVLSQLRKTNSRINSLDLRYRNQVVVEPVGSGSRSASPTQTAAGKAKRK